MQIQAEYQVPPPRPASCFATIRARFAMLAIGYGAMAGRVDAERLDPAAAQIFREFGPDHELTQEFERFIDLLPAARLRQELLTEAGQRLVLAVQRSTWPNVADRVDLNG